MNKILWLTTLSFSSLTLLVFSGEASVAKQNVTMNAECQSEKPEDIRVTQQIRQALVNDSDLSVLAKNITIVTCDGIVTLRGTVKNDIERKKITQIISGISGIRRVDNNLSINDKVEIKNSNNTSLLDSVSAYLEDNKDSDEQKKLNSSSKSSCPNCSSSDVKSDMSDSDALILQKVRKSLEMDKSLTAAAKEISIEVKNGMVILKGVVNSEDEKIAIMRKVTNIVDLKTINNQLNVKGITVRPSGYNKP